MQKLSRRRWIPSQPDETKPGPGRPSNKTVAKLMHEKGCSRATAFRVLARRQARKQTRRERLEGEEFEFSSLIKPSNNWNFFNVYYDRIDHQPGTHGYIPGDLYCNCLWYFTKPGDLVVAPMAGSGMIRHVYDDRKLWMKPRPWDLDLRMFDLTPRGRYASLIGQWDMLRGFPPIERAPDYVVMDVPYFGACRGQYSDNPDDIANMDLPGWTAAMAQIAQSCIGVGSKRCTVVVSDWVNHETGEVVLCPEIVRQAWERAGYTLLRRIYASKHIQSVRTDRIAILNNWAKRDRLPLSDIAEVLTFRLAAPRLRRPTK
jgi:ParB family chromosome partitioning protein